MGVAANSLIMFFAVGGIGFVGVASAFKDHQTTKRVHMVGAVSGIVFGMVSLAVEFGMWWLVISYVCACFTIMVSKIKNKTYWIEVVAFYYILIGVLMSILT